GQRTAYCLGSDLVLTVGVGKGNQAIVPRDGRDTEFFSQGNGGVFVTYGAQRFWRRSDEAQAGLRDALSKVRIFSQETVARIDGVDTVLVGQAQDRLDVVVFLHIVHVRSREVDNPGRRALQL